MKLTPFKKLAFVLGASIMLQGCVAAVLGGAAAGAKVATDPRTMGTQVDDETLEVKVENALDKDAQIKSEGRVHAVSYSGRVLLIGQVPSEGVKETATSLAKGVDGVNDVYNELRVGNKINFGQITKDSWITTQIKSKLFVGDNVKATDVKVITENGEVFLLGNVTQSQGNSAAEIATSLTKGVDGVNDVYNELRVGNKINFGQITKDSWITTQIKSKLFVGDNVKATDVKVITENGEVFLLGNLTRSQADSAAEIASKVTGVQKVVKAFKYLN